MYEDMMMRGKPGQVASAMVIIVVAA